MNKLLLLRVKDADYAIPLLEAHRVGDKVIPVLDLNQLLFRESCKVA